MRNELLSRVTGVENGTRGNLQATIEVGGVAYPLVCTSSFGPEVKNPNNQLVRDYLKGVLPKPHPDSPTTLLLPLQANDRCAANCKGCVFARDIVGEGFLALPTTPKTLQVILDNARVLMRKYGLLSANGTFRVGALLSGDPSFNQHTTELIRVFGENPDITAVRLSTIAVKTKNNPLMAILEGARVIKSMESNLNLRVQVSLHSTNSEKRRFHVSYHGPLTVKLISMTEINAAFGEIKKVTGFRSTLAFVTDTDTDIDPEVLSAHFDQRYTDISLRPIISTTKYTATPMHPDRFINLYKSLTERGWEVRIIPSSEKGIEQANTLTQDLPLVVGQGVLGL